MTRTLRFDCLFAMPPRNGLYKSKEHQGFGTKLVKMNQLFSERRIDSRSESYDLLHLTEKELTSNVLRRNDLLFSRTSVVADGVGKCSIISDASEDLTWDSNIIRIRLDPDQADPFFYFYFFNSPSGRDLVKRLSSGAAVTTITGTGLAASIVPVPPLAKQRRIAGILSAYDDLIENCQRRIKILEELARSLYREWFVHFRYPGHESIPLVDSPLGPIPQGWEAKTLGDLIAANIGGGWGKEPAEPGYDEPAWVIRGTDIPAARNNEFGKVPLRYHSASNLRSRRLEAGDIIFEVSGGSKGQPVGRSLLVTRQLLSAFAGDDVICASFCKRATPARGLSPEWLWLSFLEGYETGEIEQFQVQSTGISNFKWAEYLAQIQRALPTPEIRDRFTAIVKPLIAEIGLLGLQSQNLRRTRDLLLPRLLSPSGVNHV